MCHAPTVSEWVRGCFVGWRAWDVVRTHVNACRDAVPNTSDLDLSRRSALLAHELLGCDLDWRTLGDQRVGAVGKAGHAERRVDRQHFMRHRDGDECRERHDLYTAHGDLDHGRGR